MTSVAPENETLPPLPPVRRSDGSTMNEKSQQNGLSSSSDERIFGVPRRSAQRTNSSSSISSTSSSGSTISASSTNATSANGDTRKKPATRNIFPTPKADPVAPVTTTRNQPMDVMAYIDSVKSSSASQSSTAQPQQNGGPKTPASGDTAPVLHLLPMNGTFEHKAITVPFAPEVIRIGRQTNQKTVPTAQNGYFDSKVLSRQHAEVWADREGRIFIKDVKSSNGTFVNGKRLSPENKESEPHPLKEQDVLELGIDIVSEDQKTVVHHKVAARVEHAGFSAVPNDVTELTFGEMDPSSLQLGQYARNGDQLRNRAGSQGANGANGRFPGLIQTGNLMQAGYHMRNIQPVTIEQIVKRINTELKAARLQATDLKHTSSFVDAIVMNEKPPPPPPSRPTSSSPRKSFDGYGLKHMSPPPPGPPPTQPLPEAPSSATLANGKKATDIQPLLRRDTERPTAKPQSPIKVAGEKMQIRNLVEALSTAQKEISTQGEKLKEMEEALAKERESKTAISSTSPPPSTTESTPLTTRSPPADTPSPSTSAALADTSRLSSLITSMQAEMDALRIQLASYKARTEEAEDSSRRDRKSLTEMVESIRRREERARKRRALREAKVEGEKGANGHIGQHRRATSTSDSGDEGDFLDFSDDDNTGHEHHLQETLESTVKRLEKEGHKFPVHATHAVNGTVGNIPSVAHLQALGKSALEGLLPQGTGTHNTSKSTSESAEQNENAESLTASQQVLKDGDATEDSGNLTTRTNADMTSSNTNGISTSKQLTRAHNGTAMSEAAPYASLIGVVLLGVGMMAWLNGWQRVEKINM